MSKTGKVFDMGLLKRVLSFVKPYKGRFYFTGFLTILLAFLGPIRVMLIGVTIDTFIETNNKDGLLYWASLVVVALVAEAILQFFQVYLANWIGQTVIKDLRVSLFNKVTAFKLKYFDRTPIGNIVARSISDIETVRDIFSQGILTIIGDILKLVVVVAFMLYINWKFTLLALAPIPLLFFATYIFKNAVRKAFTEERVQVGRLSSFVQEHVTGMSIVQVFNREKMEMKNFEAINKQHRAAHFKSIWAYSVFFPVVEILSSVSLALVVWWGVKEVLNEQATYGNLFEFVFYIYMLFRPIRQLADRFNVLQRGIVGAERVFKVLDTDAQIENTGTITEADIKGNIEFKNVWFSYIEGEPVLKDISFQVQSGKTLALVGATGSGKSTIINLLGRFYEFEKGTICIEGEDIRDYDLGVIRKNVAVVLQDVFLFSDSILNNITLKDTSISEEQVIAAAKAVGAHNFIMKLPGQYQYDVKERGAMLSVGQRQLLAFIRAYVHNPKILVLDEATSSVDTESEELIQHAIEKLTENRTSIVIAHRLSTIQKADTILVMEKGSILESGNHDALLKLDGHYKKLYELQFKNEP